jgi:hypothetical protein
MRLIDNIKDWLSPKPWTRQELIPDENLEAIINATKMLSVFRLRYKNILLIKRLGLNQASFKAAVYDYVALHDSFNFAEFINWINE